MGDSVCPRCSGIPRKHKCEFCKGTGIHPWREGFRKADDLRAAGVQVDRFGRRLGPEEHDASPDSLDPGWLKRGLDAERPQDAIARLTRDLASARSALAEREKEIERLRAQLAVADAALNTIRAWCVR